MKKIINLPKYFLFVVFCLPLYLVKVTFFSVPSNALELLAVFGIMLVFIQNKERFFNKLANLPKVLIVGCGLILLGVLLSTLFGNDKRAGFGIFKSWFIVPLFFSFALYLTLNSKLAIKKILEAIYLSTLTVAFIAIIYKFLGIVTFDKRLSAFYLSPNHLAMYLAPGVIFAFFFLMDSFAKSSLSKKTFAHLVFLIMILSALYNTYSYGAWLALFLALLITITFAFPLRKNFFKLVFSLLIICSALLFSQFNNPKFSTLWHSPERSSLASRQTIWQVSFLLIKENPLLGIGPGNFQEAYLKLQSNFEPYLEWAVPQPHNLLLAFWLQAGLLGFAGFLLLLFFIFQVFEKILQDKKNTALAAPLLGFFLYTLLHGFIDTPYWKNDLAFLFWLVLSLALYLYNHSQEDTSLQAER